MLRCIFVFILSASALRLQQAPQEPVGSSLDFNVMVPPTEGELAEMKDLFGQYVKKSGGQASILFIGDSIQEHLYDMAHQYLTSVPGLSFLFTPQRHCVMSNAGAYALSPPPTAINYNFGLHLLHLHPAQSCSRKDKREFATLFPPTEKVDLDFEPSAQMSYVTTEEGTPLPPANCGEHQKVVEQATSYFSQKAPTSKLVYRTTNWVCTDVFAGSYKTAIEQWHDPAQRPAMEKQCRAACGPWYDGSHGDRNCGDEIYDPHSTELQRNKAVEVLKAHPEAKLLDAYTITKDRCDATTPFDGRHFRPLDATLLIKFAKLLLE